MEYYGILWNTMEHYGHPELRTTPAYPMDPICWIRHFINISLANLQEPRESMPWAGMDHIFGRLYSIAAHVPGETWP